VTTTAPTDLAGPQFTSELLAAIDAGIDPEDYLHARAQGLPYSEIATAHVQRYPLVAYADARAAGATPTQFTPFYNHAAAATPNAFGPHAWITRYYARALRDGISHAEFYSVQCAGLDLVGYCRARRYGATRKDVSQIATAHLGSLTTYANARYSGISHAEYKEASASTDSLVTYVSNRTIGMNHRSALTVNPRATS
jgi:hypothetical protein